MTEWLIHKFITNYQNTRDVLIRNRYGMLASWIGVFCNIVLVILKGLLGIAVGSISIVADAINNLSDASSNIVTLIGFRLAKKPADKEHPYGHGRYEYLASLIVCAIILAFGLQLTYQSFLRILHPTQPEFGFIVIVIMVMSIVVKAWLASFNTKVSLLIDSEVLKATAIDSKNDCITTLAILICSFISYMTHVSLDGFAGIILGAYITYGGFTIIKETLDPLLGKKPDPELVKEIYDKIMSYPKVLGTHDLLIHDYGPGRIFASADVEMLATINPLSSHGVLDDIEFDFWEDKHIQLTLHLDPIVLHDENAQKVEKYLDANKERINDDLTFRDIRVVKKHDYYVIYFECVIPYSMASQAEELRKELTEIVLECMPGSVCKIRLNFLYAEEE